jgi:hypothetical protein
MHARTNQLIFIFFGAPGSILFSTLFLLSVCSTEEELCVRACKHGTILVTFLCKNRVWTRSFTFCTPNRDAHYRKGMLRRRSAALDVAVPGPRGYTDGSPGVVPWRLVPSAELCVPSAYATYAKGPPHRRCRRRRRTFPSVPSPLTASVKTPRALPSAYDATWQAEGSQAAPIR